MDCVMGEGSEEKETGETEREEVERGEGEVWKRRRGKWRRRDFDRSSVLYVGT